MSARFLVLLIAVANSGAFAVAEQPQSSSEVFTAVQAEAGKAAYESSCVNCHSKTLIPATDAQYMGQQIPPLAGAKFMSEWGSRKTNDLANRIKVAIGGFPPKNLDEKTYLNIAAYILQVNGARAGKKELDKNTTVLVRMATAPPDASSEHR